MNLFSELKRRNVFRVGIAYSVASWLLLQIVDLVLDNINAPDWVMQVFMLGLAVGFPIAIIVAWAFELTPDGVKLEKNVDRSQSINRHTGHQLNRGIIMILSMAVVLLLTDRFRNELFSAPTDEPAQAKEIGSKEIGSENHLSEKEIGSENHLSQEILSSETPAPINGSLTPFDSKTSIAVLPFRDMSAAHDQAYFGEGIAEELLNALVKIKGLDVASRTSSFSLAGENLDIPTIATRLGVNHILEGSVRTSGQQVRVTAQLIDVSRDVHLWSETYDGSLDDIFKIQDEITGKITAALKLQLGNGNLVPSAELLTGNSEAYQLYLQGRHLWRQRSAASLREAIRLFKAAVELDPAFHRAWSNLAVAYLNLPDYDRSFDIEETFKQGLEAADRALALFPHSTEALIITASYNEAHCNIAEAARLYETAIAFSPDDPTAHHWYAIMLHTSGRMKLALEHINIAKNIDPLISAVIGIEAEIYTTLGDYARSEELRREASVLGLYGGSLYPVGLNYLYAGEIEKGKALVKQGWAGEDPAAATARQLFLEALEHPEKQVAFEQHIGKASGLREYKTIENMEYLALLGSAYAFAYQSDVKCPVFDESIWAESFREQRKTPEFFELMQRAGMVAYWHESGWPDDCASLDQTQAECR